MLIYTIYTPIPGSFKKSIYIEINWLDNFPVTTFILHVYRSYIVILMKEYGKLEVFENF